MFSAVTMASGLCRRVTAFGFGREISIKVFRTVTLILMLAWMLLIFSMSAQNATNSSKTSGNMIGTVLSVFYPGFDGLSEDSKAELIASFQFIARKAAHFSLYAILGFLSFLTVISYRNLKFGLRAALSAAICLLYAVSDEFHQLFVPGRSCELRDICIDFCGSLLMITLSALSARYINRIYKHVKWVRRDEG